MHVSQVTTPLPTVELDPPTISMTFGVNDSPLAGRDGSHVSFPFWLLTPDIIFTVLLLLWLFGLSFGCWKESMTGLF